VRVGHFWVVFCFCVKMSLCLKPLKKNIWKWVPSAGLFSSNQTHFHLKCSAWSLGFKTKTGGMVSYLTMWQIAATCRRAGCCNKLPCVTCENPCHCDRILSLQSVTQIQTGLNLWDTSQPQNKRKQPCGSSSADEAIFGTVCLGL